MNWTRRKVATVMTWGIVVAWVVVPPQQVALVGVQIASVAESAAGAL